MIKIPGAIYMAMQPGGSQVTIAHKFYYGVAAEIARSLSDTAFAERFGEAVVVKTALAAVGYYEDISADAGLWRTFVTAHKALYNRLLPIFEAGDDYIESELNRADLSFLVWYVTECAQPRPGRVSPFDPVLAQAVDIIYDILDRYYEMAPPAAHYRQLDEVENLRSEEHAATVWEYMHWLFRRSYLMPHPSFAPEESADDEAEQQAISDYPTGPLALYAHEWLQLIADPDLDAARHLDGRHRHVTPHRYYEKFVEATGGEVMRIFPDYASLNRFLSDDMGWGEAGAEGHLPQVADAKNFTLYVTAERGLLVAVNVAQYIALPGNALYDPAEARRRAWLLVAKPGFCPIDLVKYLFANGLVPDARFPWDDTGRVLLDNWDFFARLYLQPYYRAR